MMHLSGLTCEQSHAASIVAEWLELLEAFHARITPLPAAVPESGGSTASYGTQCGKPFAWLNPDGYFSKMSPELRTRTKSSDGVASATICSDARSGRSIAFLPESDLYLETWPKWGSISSGVAYRQAPWVPATSGSDGSHWPTARAEDSESCGNHPGATDSLTGAARMWKTPHGMSGTDYTGKVGGGGEFAKQVVLWSTPDVPKGDRTLTAEETANRGATAKGKRQVGLDRNARPLNEQASHWITPRTVSARGSKKRRLQGSNESVESQALAFQSSPPDQATPAGRICWCGAHGCALPSHKRKLNALFAAWLMGWPIWWCATEPMPFGQSETEWYLSRLRRCLENF